MRPGLAAAKAEVSADGLTYTFTLRDNDVHEAGRLGRFGPVKADDVDYSLAAPSTRPSTPTPSPVGGAFFAEIAGADKVLYGAPEGRLSGPKASIRRRSTSRSLRRTGRSSTSSAMSFASIVPKGSPGSRHDRASAGGSAPAVFYLAS